MCSIGATPTYYYTSEIFVPCIHRPVCLTRAKILPISIFAQTTVHGTLSLGNEISAFLYRGGLIPGMQFVYQSVPTREGVLASGVAFMRHV